MDRRNENEGKDSCESPTAKTDSYNDNVDGNLTPTLRHSFGRNNHETGSLQSVSYLGIIDHETGSLKSASVCSYGNSSKLASRNDDTGSLTSATGIIDDSGSLKSASMHSYRHSFTGSHDETRSLRSEYVYSRGNSYAGSNDEIGSFRSASALSHQFSTTESNDETGSLTSASVHSLETLKPTLLRLASKHSFEGSTIPEAYEDDLHRHIETRPENVRTLEIVKQTESYIMKAKNDMVQEFKQVQDRYTQRTTEVFASLVKEMTKTGITQTEDAKHINDSNLEVIQSQKCIDDMIVHSYIPNQSFNSKIDDSALEYNSLSHLQPKQKIDESAQLSTFQMKSKQKIKIKTSNQQWVVCKKSTGERKANTNFNKGPKEKIFRISSILPEPLVVKHLELEHTPQIIQCMNDDSLVVLMENNLLYKISGDTAIKFDFNIENISYSPETNCLYCLRPSLNKSCVHVSSIDTASGSLADIFKLVDGNKITHMGTGVNGNLVFCSVKVEHNSKLFFKSSRSKGKTTDTDTSYVHKVSIRTRLKGELVVSKQFEEPPRAISVCQSTGKVAITFGNYKLDLTQTRRPCVQVMDKNLTELYTAIGQSFNNDEQLAPPTIFDTAEHLIIADQDQGHIHLFQADSGDYIRNIATNDIKASCLAVSVDGFLVVGQFFSEELYYIKYREHFPYQEETTWKRPSSIKKKKK